MNDPEGPVTRYLWPLLASAAGAVTALSLRPWKGLTRGEIIMAVFVGFSFAYFVGPLVIGWIFGTGPIESRQLGGVYYLLASGSNALIPYAVKWISRVFGKGE